MAERTVTPFSRRFASALRGYMRERGIYQSSLAEHIGRSVGFVSEHLSGQRAVDTDMLDAVAELAGISSRHLYEEIGRRMAIAESPALREQAEGIASEARRRVRKDASKGEPKQTRKPTRRKA